MAEVKCEDLGKVNLVGRAGVALVVSEIKLFLRAFQDLGSNSWQASFTSLWLVNGM